jgi:hypothetical protein
MGNFEDTVELTSIADVVDLSKLDTETKAKSSKKIIFAIDNDECIGSWSDLSLLYGMHIHEKITDLTVDVFVDIMEKTRCVRPYVKDFLTKLIDLKKQGIIYKIFMFTAASNSRGWVDFLAQIIERWIGTKFYDGIIHKEMIEDWHTKKKTKIFNRTGYIKNMHMIQEIISSEIKPEDNLHFIAIDDRPGNIINGITIGVSPFKVAINVTEVVRLYLPDKYDYLMKKYRPTLQTSWEMFMSEPYHFTDATNDIDILVSIEHVDKIIVSIL